MLSQKNNLGLFFILCVIFYIMAYWSVTNQLPHSIPVHHDDYTNYAKTLTFEDFEIKRMTSTFIIQILSTLGADWLIWSIRFLTVLYVFQIFVIVSKIFNYEVNLFLLLLIAGMIFSTPVIVEYARYTGMITHLLSGNMALLAVILLYRGMSKKQKYMISFSIFMMICSVFAKEDFVLMYIVFLLYIMYTFKSNITKSIAIYFFVGFAIILSIFLISKYYISSAFLGNSDPTSSYYLNILPASIVQTILLYLSGAKHPGMLMHGQVVLIMFLMTLFLGLYFLKNKGIKSILIPLVILALIVPYSTLPNHVNAYYEFIWLPFIYVGFYLSIKLLLDNKLLQNIVMIICFLMVLNYDIDTRKNIATWYDNISQQNAHILAILAKNMPKINTSESVCIDGADTYSPFYMVKGDYLNKQFGMTTNWIVVPDKNETAEGFKISEEYVKTIKVAEKCPENSLVIISFRQQGKINK